MRTIKVVLVLQLSLAAAATAQDSHYWTNQFGNRARLLGGAVIGSATDLSAVYYNPGAIALEDDPELLLSANVFQYSRLTVKDALSPGQDVSSSRFNLSPSLFAGEIKSEALGDNRVAYAFLTRRESEGRIRKPPPIGHVTFGRRAAISTTTTPTPRRSWRFPSQWRDGRWGSRRLMRPAAGSRSMNVSKRFMHDSSLPPTCSTGQRHLWTWQSRMTKFVARSYRKC